MVPESVSHAVSEQYTASGEVSKQPSESDSSQTVEDETNRRYQLLGNVATDVYYRERKSGKAVADFVLASHDESGETSYHRIRTFGKQAVRAREKLSKGMQAEIQAYGIKRWEDPVKTDKGWVKKERHGYYADF